MIAVVAAAQNCKLCRYRLRGVALVQVRIHAQRPLVNFEHGFLFLAIVRVDLADFDNLAERFTSKPDPFAST